LHVLSGESYGAGDQFPEDRNVCGLLTFATLHLVPFHPVQPPDFL
jgi:hypothetical protein